MISRRLFPGLFVRVDQPTQYRHHFGGSHDINGALCVNCLLPLTQFVQLDLRDPSFELDMVSNVTTLHLLYCMRCALCWHDFVYRVIDKSEIEIVKVHDGQLIDEWYNAHLGNWLPERIFHLVHMPEELELLYDKVNMGNTLTQGELAYIAAETNHYAIPEVGRYPLLRAVNQIGGRSYLIQSLPDPECSYCATFGMSSKMYFLASLVNDPRAALKIVADDFYQIVYFYCPKCCSVHVQHSL